jgi:tetratricopeptide (TPR) repeat protein
MRAGDNTAKGCACDERAPPSLVIAPSQRTLLVLAVAVLAVLALGGAAWFWYAAAQSRSMAAYADVLVRVAGALGAEATPEARAAAARDLEAILARHPSAAAAPQAAYYLGNLRYDAGQYAAARAAYEVALARGAAGTLATLAQAGVGYAWEADRDWVKAIDAYRLAVARLGPKDFYYESLLGDLARAQELAGKKDEAVATYQRILKELPQARSAEAIRARLRSLGG